MNFEANTDRKLFITIREALNLLHSDKQRVAEAAFDALYEIERRGQRLRHFPPGNMQAQELSDTRPDNAVTAMPTSPSEVAKAIRLARFEAFTEAAFIAAKLIGPVDDGENREREAAAEVAHHIEQEILELRTAAKPQGGDPKDEERDAVVAFLLNRSEWLRQELRSGGKCEIEEQQARAMSDMVRRNRHRDPKTWPIPVRT